MAENEYLDNAIDWVKSKGFFNIKSVHDDYEDPTAFNRKNGDNSFVPSITAFFRGGKHYVEVATKTEDERRTVSKWKLLSIIAANKGGKLYLLTPRGHKAFTQQLIDSYQISAKVVSLK